MRKKSLLHRHEIVVTIFVQFLHLLVSLMAQRIFALKQVTIELLKSPIFYKQSVSPGNLVLRTVFIL